ncbi:MAG: tetratricopeptide repeat protein [Candidatus Omnitrophica bacterium]|nr:tetratricopeptide repeat protein [Candidatus Omnitrophota bacterium]
MRKNSGSSCFVLISNILVFLTLCSFLNIGFASTSSRYLVEIGKVYFEKGDYRSAAHEFKKALMIDKNDMVAKGYLELALNKVSPPSREEIVKQALDKIEIIQHISSGSLPQEKISSAPPPTKNSSVSSASKSPRPPLEEKKTLSSQDFIKISGDYQTSFGVETDGDFYWKRANYDLNERNWRMLSGDALNNYEGTYDPAIFSRLRFDLDTNSEEGFGFHANVTIDPWSFIGKSSRFTITSAGGDEAEIELLYWSNTAYVVNQTIYTQLLGDSFNIPELKLTNGHVSPAILTSTFGDTFVLPETEIHREFRPLREFWFDYKQDNFKLRIFPLALESQVYSSDDLLGLSNHHIYWDASPWLDEWAVGHFNSGAKALDFFKGYWDNSLSFFTRDSDAVRLTALRGVSFSADWGSTTLNIMLASPKYLWQDYDEFNTYEGVFRLKHSFFENFYLGTIYTGKFGFKEGSRDAANQVVGIDAEYGLVPSATVAFEAATSRSRYDETSSYATKKRGNAFSLRFITSSLSADIFGKNYYSLGKQTKDSFYKLRLQFTHFDRGFEEALANYTNTKDDTFWSRHIHFRKPFDYNYHSISGASLSWDDIEPFRIGEGIDAGRDVISLRLDMDNLLDKRLDILFDVRNVHHTNGKLVENVSRLESSYKMTSKFAVKFLGIYHKLPPTVTHCDPFLYNSQTGDCWGNNSIQGGEDPSLKTVSLGGEYAFTDSVSLNFVWERTNDTTLAYGNYPRGILNWSNFTSYYENGDKYRKVINGLYNTQFFPAPPYPYYNIFRSGLRLTPDDKWEIYLDWARNEFEFAQPIDDNANHIGLEVGFTPNKKWGFYLRYMYVRAYDVSDLSRGILRKNSYNNVFFQIHYLPTPESEFIAEFGAGGITPVGEMSWDPFGGGEEVLDLQKIFRFYYRRKF